MARTTEASTQTVSVPKKYRLWCSEKDNHAGADRSFGAKLRMEFYPDDLTEAVIDALWTGGLLS